MNITNASSATTSSSTQSNSIDKLTISYLKGEISFQQYENQLENQHFQVDLVRSRLNETNTLPTVVVTTTPDKSSPNKRKRLSNSTSSNDDKKSKIKDRFLNLKDILGEDIIINEDDDEEDDVENEGDEESMQGDDANLSEFEANSKDQRQQKRATKLMEEFIDETSNWTDFDIETLNFDKFIKDHQTSFSSPTKGSKFGNSKRKRGDDEQNSGGQTQSPGGTQNDLGELKAKRRRNRVLPIEIQGLMGEANLNYARGETNKAIDTCLEVIKYAPKASEPYQLLSLLYSEMGQNDKALRVGLIAAQLNKDADEWIGLIQQAVIEGDVELVLFCYNNAIQCNPKNIQLHVERIRLLKERKDAKRLFLARLMLLRYVDINTSLNVYNEHFEQIMSELNDETDKQKKIYVLKNDMKKFQENFSNESKLKKF
jgi:tetratricopeptide (TPR) repeat protein